MIAEVQALLDQYWVWLRDKTTLQPIEGWVEITTPYLDRHNDYLQIYVKRRDNGFIITDGGYILDDLEQSGCKIEGANRQSLLKMTLNGFGVQVEDGSLNVHASPDNFGLRKHNLVQAMLAVNDLFYLASPMVASFFYEDVVEWLELSDIRYTPKVKFTGKSGYDHLFDFVIPKSKSQPERVLKAINRPSRDAAQSIAFSWLDIREVRPPESHVYALLNDSEHPIRAGALDAMRNYDVQPVPWSDRERVREVLAA